MRLLPGPLQSKQGDPCPREMNATNLKNSTYDAVVSTGHRRPRLQDAGARGSNPAPTVGKQASLVLLGAVGAGTQNNVLIAHNRQACAMENTPNASSLSLLPPMTSALCFYFTISPLDVLKVFCNADINSITHP